MWYAPRSNIILLAHYSCTSQDLGHPGRYDGCGRSCPCRARLQVENTIVRKKTGNEVPVSMTCAQVQVTSRVRHQVVILSKAFLTSGGNSNGRCCDWFFLFVQIILKTL